MVHSKFRAITFHEGIMAIEKGREERENMQSSLEEEC